jgi:predicted ester cyclase
MQTNSENKKVVEELHRRLNGADLEGAAALAAEDLVNHAAIPQAQGRAGLLAIWKKLRAAMPDLAFQTEDLIAEGDRVVARIRVTGTQTGPFEMVQLQLPPSGKAVDFEQIHVFRVAGGRIVEHWSGMDHWRMLRQLGLAIAKA